jgi:ribose/xylose/arabinose/galactoside ABC-type transport system permease subunit
VTVMEESRVTTGEQPTARRLPGGAMLWVLLALIVLAVVLTKGVFIRPSNLTTVLFQSSVLGVLAIAQAFAVIGRGLDLSVGATAIFSAMVVGGASSTADSFMPHLPLPVAILAGLLLGLAIGAVNGTLAGRTPMPAFVITLSTYLMVVGVTFLATNASPVNSPHPVVRWLGDAQLGPVPVPVLVWVLAVGIGYLLLNRTKYGAMLYAVGGNETAARLSGIRVARVKLLSYSVAGVFAAVAGMLFLTRTGTVLPSDGGTFMLDSIAAVAVGGISLTGGHGRIRDVVLGVLILAVAGNLMNLVGVSQYLQSVVQGVIILVAVGANLRITKEN